MVEGPRRSSSTWQSGRPSSERARQWDNERAFLIKVFYLFTVGMFFFLLFASVCYLNDQESLYSSGL